MLDSNELARYSRQLAIPDFGEAGQLKLKNARVAVIGTGGLGCFSTLSLAAAGIGNIKIVDFDFVERTDLNRQVLYGEADLGMKKVDIARQRLLALNPYINVTAVYNEVTEENAASIIGDAEIVIDGTDNLRTRLIINAACVKLRIPFLFAGVARFRGMVTTIISGWTPCLACFNLENPPAGHEGVIAPSPAILANLQVMEAFKILTGRKPALAGRLLFFNGDEVKFRSFTIARNPECPVCGKLK